MELPKKINHHPRQTRQTNETELEGRTKEKERRKIRVNPDSKTREAASLANAVALPVAVHKTPTPIH